MIGKRNFEQFDTTIAIGRKKDVTMNDFCTIDHHKIIKNSYNAIFPDGSKKSFDKLPESLFGRSIKNIKEKDDSVYFLLANDNQNGKDIFFTKKELLESASNDLETFSKNMDNFEEYPWLITKTNHPFNFTFHYMKMNDFLYSDLKFEEEKELSLFMLYFKLESRKKILFHLIERNDLLGKEDGLYLYYGNLEETLCELQEIKMYLSNPTTEDDILDTRELRDHASQFNALMETIKDEEYGPVFCCSIIYDKREKIFKVSAPWAYCSYKAFLDKSKKSNFLEYMIKEYLDFLEKFYPKEC